MQTPVKVWDIATRGFHWSLVFFFTIAYLSGDEESLIHVYSSYIIIGLLAFRVIWGVIGPKYVRFSNFVVGVKPALAYLQSIFSGIPQYNLGHNPLGGWMIVLLLILLVLTNWTGLEIYAKAGKGPLADVSITLIDTAKANGDERHDRENEKGAEWLEELHEALAGFTLFLVFVHIAGVVVSGFVHRENLIKAMWTGYKTPPED